MKKVLFCATKDYHFSAFHLPTFKYFKDNGWQVDVAASGNNELPFCKNKYQIDIARSPFAKTNLKAYRQLKDIIGSGEYDLIHCHTPVGGILTRLAAHKARKKGVKVFYTAHGFHFFKGAPLLNWLIFFPIEWIMSFMTDCLITINDEDYAFAKKHLHAKRTEHVHGVGVDTGKFHPISDEEKNIFREKHGYTAEQELLIYVAELNANKNQQLLINMMKSAVKSYPNAKLILVGPDHFDNKNQELTERLGLTDNVDFLGFRSDIDELVPMCDIAVASSLREGLPVNIMEALACGLPVVASDNRGQRELVHNNENGFIVMPDETENFANAVLSLLNETELYYTFSAEAVKSVEKYNGAEVLKELRNIYES